MRHVVLERFPRQLIRALEGTSFPLRALSAVRDLRAYLERVEADALLRAREFGASPTDIAHALGVTRQGVYHKLQRLRESGVTIEETEPSVTETGPSVTIVVPELEPEPEQ